MINLLPEKEKKEIEEIEKKNKRVSFELAVIFSLVCFILSLVWIDVILRGEIKAQEVIIQSQKTEKLISEKDIEKAFSDVNKVSSFLEKNLYISDILSKISQNIPSGIYLTEISERRLEEKKKKEIDFSLSGVSKDRMVLFDFKKSLEKNFPEVIFPPSNWIEPENIEFHINIKINEKSITSKK